MGKFALRIVRGIVLMLAVGLAASAVYLNLTASRLLTSFAPPLPIPLILATGMSIVLLWLAFSRSLPSQAANGREIAGLPAKPKAARSQWAGALVIGIGIPTWLYFRHITRSHDQPLWIDAYWPVLLPVTVGLTTIAWGYDTFFARIVTGTATGKSAAGQRLKLVAERSAAVILSAATIVLTQLAFSWHLSGQPAYQTC